MPAPCSGSAGAASSNSLHERRVLKASPEGDSRHTGCSWLSPKPVRSFRLRPSREHAAAVACGRQGDSGNGAEEQAGDPCPCVSLGQLLPGTCSARRGPSVQTHHPTINACPFDRQQEGQQGGNVSTPGSRVWNRGVMYG